MIVNKYDAKLLKYSLSKKFYYLGLSNFYDEKEVFCVPIDACYLANSKGSDCR